MRSKLLAKALKTPAEFTLVIYFYRHELISEFVEASNDIKYRLNQGDFLVSNASTTIFFGDGGRLAFRQAASLDDGRYLQGLEIQHLEIRGPVPPPVIEIAQTRIRPKFGG